MAWRQPVASPPPPALSGGPGGEPARPLGGSPARVPTGLCRGHGAGPARAPGGPGVRPGAAALAWNCSGDPQPPEPGGHGITPKGAGRGSRCRTPLEALLPGPSVCPSGKWGEATGGRSRGPLFPPTPASDSTGSLRARGTSEGQPRANPALEIAEAGGAGSSGSGWPGLTHRPCERLAAWWPEEGREGQRGGEQEGPGRAGGQHRRLTVRAAVEAPGAPLGRGGTLGQAPWEEEEGENVGKATGRKERTERQGPQKHREEGARPCRGRRPSPGTGMQPVLGGQ